MEKIDQLRFTQTTDVCLHKRFFIHRSVAHGPYRHLVEETIISRKINNRLTTRKQLKFEKIHNSNSVFISSIVNLFDVRFAPVNTWLAISNFCSCKCWMRRSMVSSHRNLWKKKISYQLIQTKNVNRCDLLVNSHWFLLSDSVNSILSLIFQLWIPMRVNKK